MTAVLGDVRGDGGQFGDLMPSGIANAVSCVQAVGAVAARLRHQIDNRIDALDGHQLPMMPRMPRLSPGLTSTLHVTPPLTLLTREAIG